MRCTGLILALLAIGATDAHAATVTSSERSDRTVTEIRFDAAPGEANRLAATREGAVWRIRDTGATVTPGGICRAVDEHELLCEPTTRDSEVHAALGDRDDELLGLGDVRADGGAGNDRLVARQADGGPGDDVLLGGDENDSLSGGPGRDVVRGGGGEDVLLGGSGRDRIDAGYDRDRVDGGAGRDRLWSAKDFASDRVRCDARDRVTAERGERLEGLCTTVARLPVRRLWVDAQVLGGQMFAVVTTPTSLSDSGYSGRLRLRVQAGRRWVSLGTHRIDAAAEATGWFRLPARVARALARGSHPLRGIMVLDPGLRAGMLPIPLRGRTFVQD